MLSVDYISAACLSQPKTGTHSQNKRKSYYIVIMWLF